MSNDDVLAAQINLVSLQKLKHRNIFWELLPSERICNNV